MGTRWADGYSAQVTIYLIVDDETLGVAAVGPDSFHLREARAIPPNTSATLVLKIDAHEERDEIVLFEGASPTSTKVRFF
jgi:hypothetical protein